MIYLLATPLANLHRSDSLRHTLRRRCPSHPRYNIQLNDLRDHPQASRYLPWLGYRISSRRILDGARQEPRRSPTTGPSSSLQAC